MEWILYLILALLLSGLVFVIALFVIINLDYNRRQDRAQELESFYGIEQVQRALEKFNLVRTIGSPECPDGTYSPAQLALWRRYQDLDDWDKAVTAFELELIVETRGYS